MNRDTAYNILTQLLSDLDDLSGFDREEVEEYSEAIETLDDGALESEKMKRGVRA